MRTIVAGSRHFINYDLLASILDTHRDEITVLIHGACPGVDLLAELWAQERGIRVESFPADWTKHGKAAGPIRNATMADSADALIAFPSGGRGTADMIQKARARGLKVTVYPQ